MRIFKNLASLMLLFNVSVVAAPPQASALPIDATDVARYEVLEDGILQATLPNGVLRNDSDANGDALTASLVQGPLHGTLALNADGTFTYTPNADFNGSGVTDSQDFFDFLTAFFAGC